MTRTRLFSIFNNHKKLVTTTCAALVSIPTFALVTTTFSGDKFDSIGHLPTNPNGTVNEQYLKLSTSNITINQNDEFIIHATGQH
jgi:hypothetical protein